MIRVGEISKTPSARYHMQVVSAPFLPLQHKITCIAIMWISAKRSFREICFQVTDTMAKFTFLPPPGFDEDPNYVYQLRLPLYGMPSAARAWHHTMSSYLKSQ
jgi:hypothetical protein